MKRILIVILSVVLCSILLAQNKVDNLVNKSKNIDPQYEHLIYDYRIPDWGYNRLSLYFYSNLYGNNDDNDKNPSEREYTNTRYNGRIQPYFNLYRTSEKYIFSLYSSIDSYYDYYDERNEYDDHINKSLDQSLDHGINISGNLNQYYGRLFYLSYNLINSFDYREDHNHYRYINKNSGSTSNLNSWYIQN